jgi:hypothetical protein
MPAGQHTEVRTVYRNFDLANLNVNLADRTHMLYNRCLCYNRFLPPSEKNYFAHLATNTLAAAPGSPDDEKGAFNIFPLSPDHRGDEQVHDVRAG